MRKPKRKTTKPKNNSPKKLTIRTSPRSNNNSSQIKVLKLLKSDAENNNTIASPKCRKPQNQKKNITPKVLVPIDQLETVVKIEIDEHDLGLENMQALEGIHNNYNEIIALDSPLTVDTDSSNDISQSNLPDEATINIVDEQNVNETKNDTQQFTSEDNFIDEEIINIDDVEQEEVIQDIQHVHSVSEDNSLREEIININDLIEKSRQSTQQMRSVVYENSYIKRNIDNMGTPRKDDTLQKNTKHFSIKKEKLSTNRQRKIRRKNIDSLEKYERLFIRLVKFDLSVNTNKSSESIYVSDTEENSQNTPLIKQEAVIKKVTKTEIQRSKLQNVNKSESIRMEELLLRKFRKSQAALFAEEVSNSTSGDDIVPYEYEKTSKSVYETYEQTVDENGIVTLRCLLCPFTGETFKQMSLHYKFKHRDTPLEEMHFCDVQGCKFKAVHKGMLIWHMRRHRLATSSLKLQSYPCDKCDRVFDQRKGFLIHLKHSHGDNQSSPKKTEFPCGTCKFKTNTKQNLQAHIYRSHVPDNMKPNFKCNICGLFETNYKNSLKNHLARVHLKLDSN